MGRIGVIAGILILSVCATISLLFVVSPKHVPIAGTSSVEVHPPTQMISPQTIYLPPVRLTIAKLSINAAVAAVALAADNTMDIDKQDTQGTAWYKLGPKPGEVGSAVIAGHYGWKDNQGSIFNNLHTLSSGD